MWVQTLIAKLMNYFNCSFMVYGTQRTRELLGVINQLRNI